MPKKPTSKDRNLARYTPEFLLDMYQAILLPRLIEEKMLLLLRQGKVSKWFSGIGQEAIAVGVTMALESDEYILPLHRNLGVFTTRKIPLERLIAQWQGKTTGFTQGRDRSFHFGTQDFHIVGMISHLGPQLCVADGIALARTLANERKVTVVFSGEGGTSQGDFHEALNVASVWNLGVIFIVENNGYALSTRPEQQFKCEKLSDRAVGYGIEGRTIDGNNLVEVYSTIQELAASIRKRPRPVLLECMTFRMRGHEEASGIKYVPKSLLDEWGKRDPVRNFEELLMGAGILTGEYRDKQISLIKGEIDDAVEIAFSSPEPEPDNERELRDVYAPSVHPTLSVSSSAAAPAKRFIDALAEALDIGLAEFSNLVIMGQDIADYGGVFKVTEGLLGKYGAGRIRNTPLCESAILGAALGLSIRDVKSIVEMQFADFVSSGFNQIINNFAKTYYRWGQKVDVVVRMPTGAGTGAGPFHSQSNEAWFFHTPGLKVVYPSTPADAKGLLLAAIRDPNPVLFFEHKQLYRSISGPVLSGYYETPIGVANLVKTGSRLVIITYGAGVHWALSEAARYGEDEIAVLDLRTLLPLDWKAVEEAVKETGRVVVLHEDTLTGGVGAEVAAYIGEHLFQYLDAPVVRIASLDTPVPFSPILEKSFLPQGRLSEAVGRLMGL